MMYIYTVPDIISFTTYAHTRKTHKSALLSPLSQRTTTLKMPHGNHGCMHISLFKSPHIYTFSYKSLLKHAISCQLFMPQFTVSSAVNLARPATLSKILSARLFPITHNWSHPHHISVQISHVTHFLAPHFILWSCHSCCSLSDGMLYVCQQPTAE
jgi:hypothetical protein